VKIEWPLKFIVMPLRLTVGLLGRADIEPLVYTIGIRAPFAVHGFARVGSNLDLDLQSGEVNEDSSKQVRAVVTRQLGFKERSD
jgi:hypothetical protein